MWTCDHANPAASQSQWFTAPLHFQKPFWKKFWAFYVFIDRTVQRGDRKWDWRKEEWHAAKGHRSDLNPGPLCQKQRLGSNNSELSTGPLFLSVSSEVRLMGQECKNSRKCVHVCVCVCVYCVWRCVFASSFFLTLKSKYYPNFGDVITKQNWNRLFCMHIQTVSLNLKCCSTIM